MRLIDILNKIANGELKEGAKVELGNKTYAWDNIECCLYNENEYFMCLDPMKCLNDEVELIEPQEPTDNTKIEELKYDETDLECLGIHSKTLFLSIADKLNEVINKVNAQTTVVLAHQKDIEEIKNDLDY